MKQRLNAVTLGVGDTWSRRSWRFAYGLTTQLT
jgi:hypothetical protein